MPHVLVTRAAAALLTAFLALAAPARAQGGGCQPDWLPTFGAASGTDGTVFAMETFDDGNGPALYLGGTFVQAGGLVASRVVRWDGARWSRLGSGLNDGVRALAVFDDGSGPAIYAGGTFLFSGSASVRRVARWDGTAWSQVGPGLNVNVRALEVFDDGSGPALYAGLASFNFGGNLVRWDGAAWVSVGGGLGSQGAVFAVESLDDGSGPALYVGGAFESAGGMPVDRIARWDGASWSALGGGMDSGVHSLALFDDGLGGGPRIVAGGNFNLAGGVPAQHVAAWDGSSWSPLGGGLPDIVRSLFVFDDGGGPRLFAGWGDDSVGAPTGLACWDGVTWTTVGGGVDGLVGALTSFDAGSGPELLVGGLFPTAGGIAADNVARWDGGGWSVLGTGLSRTVHALAVHDDGLGAGPTLFAAGAIEAADGVTLDHVARWDAPRWAPVGGGLDQTGRALAVFDDGSGPALYAGGDFTQAGGVGANGIARWDGTSWAPLGSGVAGGSPASVAALVELDDGSGPALIAGGLFTSAGGVPASSVAAWDGTSWSALGGGVDGQVQAMAVFDAGGGPELYVGGAFALASGLQANHVARWDGSSWSTLGSGVSGGISTNVASLAVFHDGNGPALYVGGAFDFADGVLSCHIARWDGSSFSPVGAGTNGITVAALGVYDDRTGGGPALYAGGAFTVAGGVPASRLARWSGTSWSAVGQGTNDTVRAFVELDDGLGTGPVLCVAGSFRSASDSGDSHVARWGGCSSSVLRYCQGELSSLGCVSSIDTTGVPSATGTNPFALVARDMIPGEAGFILYGFQKANLAFHGGRLCIKAPIQRWLPPKAAKSTGSPPCTGVLSRDFNARIQSGADAQLTAGQTVFAQWLQRDPADPGGNLENLTNAVRFVICP